MISHGADPAMVEQLSMPTISSTSTPSSTLISASAGTGTAKKNVPMVVNDLQAASTGAAA